MSLLLLLKLLLLFLFVFKHILLLRNHVSDSARKGERRGECSTNCLNKKLLHFVQFLTSPFAHSPIIYDGSYTPLFL